MSQPVTRITGDRPDENNTVNVDRAVSVAAIASGKPRVSLRMVRVRVSGTNAGPEIEIYTFLDDVLDVTVSSNSLAETLGLSEKPVMFSLTTKNEEDCSRSGFEVELNVKRP